MTSFKQNLLYAFRSITKNPGFSLIAILTLGVGIGANAAIFGIINAVILRPLPYEAPDRLVHMLTIREGRERPFISYPNFEDFSSQDVFEGAAVWQGWEATVAGISYQADRLAGASVSSNFFDVLGARPVAGRFFEASDEESGELVIVLSYGLWQQRLGGDESALGRKLSLVGNPVTIIGVAPPEFRDPLHRAADRQEPTFWLAMRSFSKYRQLRQYLAVARLKQGVTVEAAQAQSDALGQSLAQQYPDTNEELQLRLVGLKENMVGSFRPAMLVLLGAVFLLLLIACANVANLLLSRSTVREREVALRTALGASRFQLISQFSIESLILSLLGGIAGLGLAWGSTRFLYSLQHLGIPRATEAELDWTVVGFTAAICILTGLIFGLAPSLHALRSDLRRSLGEGGRGSSAGGASYRLRNGLVVAEFAFCLLLLIGAGLLMQSFANLQRVDPGLEMDTVLTMEVSLSPRDYRQAQDRTAVLQRILTQLSGLPSVDAAGAISHLPFSGAVYSQGISREDRPQPEDPPGALMRAVLPGYFEAMGIPLQKGRSIRESDDPQSPRVAVISANLEQLLYPGEDALGKRVNANQATYDIVGVVGDVKQFGLDSDADRTLYVPFAQEEDGWLHRYSMFLAVRSSGDPLDLVQPVRRVLEREDSAIPVAKVRTMRDLAGETIAAPRVYSILLAVFAGVALLLAVVGIAGVMAYSVSRRTHEIGVYLALGAQRRDVLIKVIVQGMKLAAAGLVIGLIGAFALSRTLSSLLFGVTATDLGVFAAVALLLVAVALAACFLPAYRASRVDPLTALRAD